MAVTPGGPYNIPDDVAPGTPDFYPWQHDVADSINDLDLHRALKTYADMADLDSVETAELGWVRDVADIGAATGYADLNGIAGSLLVSTTVSTESDGWQTCVQTSAFFDGYWRNVQMMRARSGFPGSWGAWDSAWDAIPPGDNFYDIFTIKADGKQTVTSATELDNINAGIVVWATDWAAYTGLDLPSDDITGWIFAGRYVSGDPNFPVVGRTQFGIIPSLGGTIRTISRKHALGAWEPWALSPSDLTHVTGYNGSVAQRLTHDSSGDLLWVNE